MGVQPPQQSSQETSWIMRGTPAAMWPGLTSPSISPAPLPGPVLGLATPLAAPARGWDQMDLLDDAKPKKGRAWGSNHPETVF